MKRTVYVLIVIWLITCCSNKGSLNTQLVLIDSLLEKEQTDSAYYLVQNMSTSDANDEDVAYYYLLYNQTLYKKYMSIDSDSTISIAVSRYELTGNNEKLARSLYCRGCIRYGMGKKVAALEDLKSSMSIAGKLVDETLKHNIVFMIGTINLNSNEAQLALDYFKKAVDYSVVTKRKDHLLYDYEKMAVCYSMLGERDSNFIYSNKIVALINNIPRKPAKNMARVLTVIGNTYYHTDMEKAETILNKALSMDSLGSTCGALAMILLKKRDTTNACKLIEEAIHRGEDLHIKIHYLQLNSRIEQQKGNQKRALELSQEAYKLADSLARVRQKENILAQQIEYDRKAELNLGAKKRRIMMIAVTLVLAAGAVMLWWQMNRSRRTRQQLAEDEMLIEELREQKRKANKDLSTARNKIEDMRHDLQEHKRQQRKSDKDSQQLARNLEHGCALMSELKNGGNILHWVKRDLTDFASYYCAVNPGFSEELEVRYDSLTPSQLLFLILEQEHKSDEEILQIMCLKEGALRTLRSRLKHRKR